MFHKKALLSLGAAVCFASCAASTTEVRNTFLKKTHAVLNTEQAEFARTEFNFKADGKAGRDFYWVMTADQFETFRELIEYAVAGYEVVVDENDPEMQHIVFTDKVGLEKNAHFCCVRKASLFEKLLMCVKSKSITPFLANPFIHVADSDGFTHVAIRCDLQIKEFDVVDRASRIYRNVPATSTIGNLPGVYLRGNGTTAKNGNLIGFSFRSEKNGPVSDYFFDKIWTDEIAKDVA